MHAHTYVRKWYTLLWIYTFQVLIKDHAPSIFFPNSKNTAGMTDHHPMAKGITEAQGLHGYENPIRNNPKREPSEVKRETGLDFVQI